MDPNNEKKTAELIVRARVDQLKTKKDFMKEHAEMENADVLWRLLCEDILGRSRNRESCDYEEAEEVAIQTLNDIWEMLVENCEDAMKKGATPKETYDFPVIAISLQLDCWKNLTFAETEFTREQWTQFLLTEERVEEFGGDYDIDDGGFQEEINARMEEFVEETTTA
jgi:hypothetical protein